MTFSEWLANELEDREWTSADLSRNANISRGSISNIMSGIRQPGTDVCEAIARAFKISPEIVYRHAGLLPPVPKADEKRQELSHLFDLMTEDNKEDQLAYARMKLEKQEREEKNNAKRSRASQGLR